MISLMIALALAASQPAKTAAEQPEGPPTPATETELAAIRKGLEDVLADAESARFKDVMVRHGAGRGGTACGQMNAKNRYGAYVGYDLFEVTLIDGADAGLLVFAGGTNPAIARTLCKQHGM